MRRLSYLLIGFGILCLGIGFYLMYQRMNPTRLSFQYKQYLAEKPYCKAGEMPVRLTIKSLGIDLPIMAGRANKYDWETTTAGVSYLIASPVPGNMGNSILYGHNWTNLLGNLVKAKPGQEITIWYRDGSKKTFVIDTLAKVSPTDTSILHQTSDKRITVYTCTGFMDSKRFVVTAKLQEEMKEPLIANTKADSL